MFLDRIFAALPDRQWDGEPGEYGWIGLTQAGESVSDHKALMLSAVWRCVNIIASDIKVLPWGVYEKQADKRIRRRDHPVDKLLSVSPNPETDAASFRASLQMHQEMKGNGYAEIERDFLGAPKYLWILPPDTTQPKRTASGELYYEVRHQNGKTSIIRKENILHVKNITFDGVNGLSVLEYAKETLGGGLAMEKTGNSFFRNGFRPSGVLEHPGKLGDKALKNLRQTLHQVYGGSGNTGKPFVAEEGMKWHQLSISPEQSQFLESRQFSVEEISRWFGVKAYKLGLQGRETHSNIFQNAKEHLEGCILPRCIAWEMEAKRKLFGDEERESLYTKFDFNAMLRADPKERSEYYRNMSSIGVYSIDEIRAKEDENPLEDGLGSVRLVPMNMEPLKSKAGNNVSGDRTRRNGQAAAADVAGIEL